MIINKAKQILSKPSVMCLLTALTLNFTLEILGRRSFAGTFRYLISSPLMFFYNMAIIALTLSIGLFVKRMIFTFSLISAVWLTLGITNFVVLGFRTTPLSNVDFKIIKTAFKMIGIYLSFYQIVLIVLLIFVAFAGIIFLWFKAPKQKIAVISAVSVSLIAVCIIFLSPMMHAEAHDNDEDFTNLAIAYEDYGFAYGFSKTVLESGIKKPDDYSESSVKAVLSELKSDSVLSPTKPNIITIQLESFFDVKYLNNFDKEDPIPNFTELKENYPSGFLTVPSFGSGTAYTEFEILTGISVDSFGPGECPYYSVAKEKVCPSVAHDLKMYGYSTHAIHNNTGTFYERNIVYPNLGFNTFTSLEYMYGTEYTPNGWAKDYILTEVISDCLTSTASNDFVFAVSVQPHGAYPYETETSAFDYYVGQIREVDEFIGELIEYLSEFEEPVVLVLYGDHLPALELYDSDLSEGNLYQTEYVVWTNCEIPETENIGDGDLYSYELMPAVCKLFGYELNPILTARNSDSSDLSEDDILTLSYDLLYGDNFSGITPRRSNMKMGIREIIVTGVYQIDDSVYIKGENFNEYSVAFVNESARDTIYIDTNTLIIPKRALRTGDEISVAQISADYQVLSTSDYCEYINHKEVWEDENENSDIGK